MRNDSDIMYPALKALRTYIKNLRKYLGKEKIVSIKKLGYRFTTK